MLTDHVQNMDKYDRKTENIIRKCSGKFEQIINEK